jgi:hypothetical protein
LASYEPGPTISRGTYFGVVFIALCCLIVGLLMWASRADAQTLISPAPHTTIVVSMISAPPGTPFADYAQQSKMPVPSVTVRVHYCPAYGPGWECYDPTENVIYVPRSGVKDRESFYHELGHAFDAHYLTDEDRMQLALELGYGPSDWYWQCNPKKAGCPLPPMEIFAEMYMECSLGRKSPDCRWIRSLAKRGSA